jgi:hypothetical protein
MGSVRMGVLAITVLKKACITWKGMGRMMNGLATTMRNMISMRSVIVTLVKMRKNL